MNAPYFGTYTPVDGPSYILERWPHGWVVSSVGRQSGVPMGAISEVTALLRNKDLVIDAGIAHHLSASGRYHTAFCIVAKDESKLWRDSIEKSLQDLPSAVRWWLGTDVGTSAASIFATFYVGNNSYKQDARVYSNGTTPNDAGDFGRFRRLLDLFPEWRANLHKVARDYPETRWPSLVQIWSILESATPEEVYSILSSNDPVTAARALSPVPA